MARKLTKKEKGFADDLLEGKKKRQAIKDNFNLGSKGGDIEKLNQTADSMGQETSNKPAVIAYLEDNAYEAVSRIVEMSKTAKNEPTKLNANKDILDRAGFKPSERVEHSGEVKVEHSENIDNFKEVQDITLEYEDKLKKSINA